MPKKSAIALERDAVNRAFTAWLASGCIGPMPVGAPMLTPKK